MLPQKVELDAIHAERGKVESLSGCVSSSFIKLTYFMRLTGLDLTLLQEPSLSITNLIFWDLISLITLIVLNVGSTTAASSCR